MVLSNKKQKQKLRAARAEVLAAYPGKSGDLNLRDSNSLGIITGQDSQKGSLSKREKRRQKSQDENLDGSKSNETSDKAEKKKRKRDGSSAQQENLDGSKSNEISDATEKVNADDLNSDGTEVKKKKKRKSDDGKTAENVKEKAVPLKKKKKNQKKKKKAKKNVENGIVKEEGQQNGSTPNGEYPVATLDEASKRNEVAEVVPDKVYVGGIPYYSTEDDIRSYFEHCGTITEIDCMTFPDTGKFRGIAILSFKTEAAAKRALALDGSDMGGLFLKIQPYKSAKVIKTSNFAPSVMEGYNRIYAGNLSWDITEDDLKNLFSGCDITSIRWGTDKETGEFKGYGHVDFADSASLIKALKLDQTVLYGRPVKISCAVPKKGAVNNLRPTPKDEQFETVKVSPVTEEPRSIQKDNPVDIVKVTEDVSSTRMDIQPENVKISAVSEVRVNSRAAVTPVSVVRVNSSAVAPVSEVRVNSSAVTPVSSKIRRRTCYECGEKGHLSSACPNKPAVDSTNPDAK